MNGSPKPPDELIRDYKHRGVIIDTNLLVVYLIGIFDSRHLSNCRATKSFSVDDHHRLVRLIDRFDLIMTTPHVLAEVSNLALSLPKPVAERFMGYFGSLLAKRSLQETYTAADQLSLNPAFPRFGITDVAISAVAPDRHLVLTVDFALVGLLRSRGVDVVNFNHLRSF